MQAGMAARIAAADADPLALQQPRVVLRRLRGRALVFLLLGVAAYLIGLIALIPAKVVLTEADNLKVGGTIWNGEAVLASTVKIDWQFAPVRTLTELAFSADFHMAGGGTDLAGSVTQVGDALRLTGVSGQVDGTLLAGLAPNLPVTCRFVAQTQISRVVLGGSSQSAEAMLRVSPAACQGKAAGGAPFDLPATRFEASPDARGSRGALVTVTGRQRLLEARLSRDGNLSIWPTADLVRLAPVLGGIRYDTRIE